MPPRCVLQTGCKAEGRVVPAQQTATVMQARHQLTCVCCGCKCGVARRCCIACRRTTTPSRARRRHCPVSQRAPSSPATPWRPAKPHRPRWSSHSSQVGVAAQLLKRYQTMEGSCLAATARNLCVCYRRGLASQQAPSSPATPRLARPRKNR